MNWAAVLLHPRHAYGSPSTTLLLFIGYKYMQGVGTENRSYSIDLWNQLTPEGCKLKTVQSGF